MITFIVIIHLYITVQCNIFKYILQGYGVDLISKLNMNIWHQCWSLIIGMKLCVIP